MQSATEEGLSEEEINLARDKHHDKLRANYSGQECGNLAVNYHLCLFNAKQREKSETPASESVFHQCKEPHMTALQKCLVDRKNKSIYIAGQRLTEKQIDERKERVQRKIDERKEAGIEITKEEFLKMSLEIQKDDTKMLNEMMSKTRDMPPSPFENLSQKINEDANKANKPWWRKFF